MSQSTAHGAGAQSTAHRSAARNQRLAGVLALVVVAIVVVATVLLLRRQSSPALDLTGKWVAQYNLATVDLTLTAHGNDLTGKLVARNSPIPVDVSVVAHVEGTNATVRLDDHGTIHTGQCTVSNTKMTCEGTGKDKNTLSLTFTRP